MDSVKKLAADHHTAQQVSAVDIRFWIAMASKLIAPPGRAFYGLGS